MEGVFGGEEVVDHEFSLQTLSHVNSLDFNLDCLALSTIVQE
jgi:hypothetical protein